MHRVFRRPATIAFLVSAAALLLPASSASADESSASCGPNSTEIITGGMHPSNKVWIDGVNLTNPLAPQVASRIVVCVTMDNSLFFSGGMAIVFDAGSGVITPPAVDVTYDPTACGNVTPQWNSTTPNLALLVNPATLAVCIRTGDPMTQADVWTSVQFGMPSIAPGSLPTLEVWKDGGANWGFIDAAFCPVEYTLYLRGLGGEECMMDNKQVF